MMMGCYADLSKAYDYVDADILKTKLRRFHKSGLYNSTGFVNRCMHE